MGSSSSREQQRPAPQERPYAQGPQFNPPPYVNNGRYYGHWQSAYGSHTPYPPRSMPPPPPQQQQQQRNQPKDQELAQTSTISNAVNLKKKFLHLAPVEGEPHKLAVLFSFDASSPCKVTVFAMASEDKAEGCKLTALKQPPTPGIVYEQGLGLKFPKADGAACIIDTSLYEPAALMPGQGTAGPFPLVVRLETITAQGLTDGHTLEELEAGASQRHWVQSQTTFAEIDRDTDGAFVPRVLLQKIWVEGISYELHEIYGMHEYASGNKGAEEATQQETAEEAEERLCVICLVNDRDTTVLPCRHMCMCHECAQELRKQTSKCPICRNHVESLLHIRMRKGPVKVPQGAAAEAVAAKIEDLKV